MSRTSIIVLFVGFIMFPSTSLLAQRPTLKTESAKTKVVEFDEAFRVLEGKHKEATAKLSGTYDQEVQKIRNQLTDSLAILLDSETKSGNLDEAIAIREAIGFYKSFDPRRSSNSKSSDEKIRAENAILRSQLKETQSKLDSIAEMSRPRIPKEAVSWNGHHYLRIDQPATRAVALRMASSVGGHLVTVENPSEQAFVFNIVRSGTQPYYHLDGTDEEQEGTWLWHSGQKVGYLDWDVNEPTGPSRRGSVCHQHDLLMNPKNGKMHDGVCGDRIGYVIEWDE